MRFNSILKDMGVHASNSSGPALFNYDERLSSKKITEDYKSKNENRNYESKFKYSSTLESQLKSKNSSNSNQNDIYMMNNLNHHHHFMYNAHSSKPQSREQNKMMGGTAYFGSNLSNAKQMEYNREENDADKSIEVKQYKQRISSKPSASFKLINSKSIKENLDEQGYRRSKPQNPAIPFPQSQTD